MCSSIISTVLSTDIKMDIKVHIEIKNIVNALPETSAQDPQEYADETEYDP